MREDYVWSVISDDSIAEALNIECEKQWEDIENIIDDIIKTSGIDDGVPVIKKKWGIDKPKLKLLCTLGIHGPFKWEANSFRDGDGKYYGTVLCTGCGYVKLRSQDKNSTKGI